VPDRIAAIHVPITTVPETAALVRRAEELGVRAIWLTSGGYGPDSLTTLAVIGARTERILIGTSIAVTFSRHPLVMAQQAMAIDDVAPGRFRLGIGTSHRPTVENAYGLAFDRPLQQLRYVYYRPSFASGTFAIEPAWTRTSCRSGSTFAAGA